MCWSLAIEEVQRARPGLSVAIVSVAAAKFHTCRCFVPLGAEHAASGLFCSPEAFLLFGVVCERAGEETRRLVLSSDTETSFKQRTVAVFADRVI